ncbi:MULTISPECIES: flagellar basal body P-ring formation chaperone FlgA [unclassified Herbaspirillum]|uniref:flagellar basal body P-ring formation chaperone FlgA n=1 Tax=unclassified Herbaspirillum TaxID=2624150 RepID=UPI001170E480|nr:MULTISPECIES: flagellar basal body P-ring formation chaperone FlgA [unclassified Herbaspirillum]MBB5392906.1 flagella basal body P-ring formation protein FlgA [Herbaspirillum sp. SJZ102]TQK04448.1 flagella basal body P-ring formation protein FlgA [Herbaspirillum sp. SJZ130]TQK09767.1 flagella basal body P-ring formation protein FlgA [Herbaspirillum sp. SJZ106]TWC65883.1 flagella basal body P-ring formation protein FlgA [Herbaspirillum sp. SJZ099]
MKQPSRVLRHAAAVLALLACGFQGAFAQADPNAPQRQDLPALQQVAEQFLKTQTSGLPGSVTVDVDPVDPRLNLNACIEPQAFMPNGARLWGRTTIGIKCVAPSPWTVYVRANVRVVSDYLVAAVPLVQGQTISAADVTRMRGDLSGLPNGIITDESQAVGRVASMSVRAGTPLRMDTVRNQRVVQQGQPVRVVSNGPGFQISTEARALSNASEGQMAQARTAAGQVVSGIAKAGGILEINY